MNTQRRRHLASLLKAERARLSSAVRALESEPALDIEEAPESDAPSVSVSDAEAADAAASMQMDELREIDAAIARLHDDPDHFGRCLVCGQEIARERLERIPWAQRCINHTTAPSSV